jgi:hypothetical protein
MDPIHDLVIRYIQLGHSINDHLPDYVDAYFGQEAWVVPDEEREQQSPLALNALCEELLLDVHSNDALETGRKRFWVAQVEAMHMAIQILLGEELPLEEKIEGLFGFTPKRTDETVFQEVHNQLDGLLPPGGTLRERVMTNRERLIVPREKLESLFTAIVVGLRDRTKEHFPLPADERFEMHLVEDKPWSGFCEYLGEGLSRIEINTSMSIQIMSCVELAAHEIYPGHHTENSIKEEHWVKVEGQNEHSIILALSPRTVQMEGIATNASEVVISEQEMARWLQSEVFPSADLDDIDASHQLEIRKVAKNLNTIMPNAIFKYWVEGESAERVEEYILEYSLEPADYIENWVKNWLSHPVWHLYSFNYPHGRELVENFIKRAEEPQRAFANLLRHFYLPEDLEKLGKSDGS